MRIVTLEIRKTRMASSFLLRFQEVCGNSEVGDLPAPGTQTFTNIRIEQVDSDSYNCRFDVISNGRDPATSLNARLSVGTNTTSKIHDFRLIKTTP